MTGMITIKANKTLESRQETLDNQGYTVYPVIMMNEGVHNDILYSLAELGKFPESWNGIPVPVFHPEVNGVAVSANSPQVYNDSVIGKIFNTHIENTSLKAEIWLNNDKVNAMAPDVRDFLQAGGEMDVSTGLFSDDLLTEGVFNGEVYKAVAINIRPDHLAVLPGVNGACSWADGCGIRANQDKTKTKGGKMERGNKKEFIKDNDEYFEPLSKAEIKTYADDYTETVKLLRDAVNAMDVDNQRYYYLSRAYSTHAIYRVNYTGTNEQSKYLKQDYSLQDGKVNWTSEAIEVVKNTTFTPKVQTFEDKTIINKENEDMSEIKTMKECCPDKVEELIKENSNFTEDHRETLLGMSEDAFALTINAATPIEPKKVEDAVPTVNGTKKEETTTLTFDELLANASPEDRESIEMGKRMLSNNKKALVEKIKANETNQFTDTELNGFGFDMLEKIAGSIPAKVNVQGDYSMNNPGNVNVNAATDGPEPLPSPHANWEKKD